MCVAVTGGSLRLTKQIQLSGVGCGTLRKMTFLWILLGILYVACWVYFGLATFRKGHYWLFWIGFFLPFLWIIGALIARTPRAAGMA